MDNWRDWFRWGGLKRGRVQDSLTWTTEGIGSEEIKRRGALLYWAFHGIVVHNIYFSFSWQWHRQTQNVKHTFTLSLIWVGPCGRDLGNDDINNKHLQWRICTTKWLCLSAQQSTAFPLKPLYRIQPTASCNQVEQSSSVYQMQSFRLVICPGKAFFILDVTSAADYGEMRMNSKSSLSAGTSATEGVRMAACDCKQPPQTESVHQHYRDWSI